MNEDKAVMSKLKRIGAPLAVILAGGFLVAPYEGKVNKTYVDPVGIITSCYGHTGPELKLGQRYTDGECYNTLGKDLIEADMYVKGYVKVPLTIYQNAAIDSFVYNVGVGKFKKSTLLKKFNSGDYQGGCEELMKWVYADGKMLKGLVSRRSSEYKVCVGEIPLEKFLEEYK